MAEVTKPVAGVYCATPEANTAAACEVVGNPVVKPGNQLQLNSTPAAAVVDTLDTSTTRPKPATVLSAVPAGLKATTTAAGLNTGANPVVKPADAAATPSDTTAAAHIAVADTHQVLSASADKATVMTAALVNSNGASELVNISNTDTPEGRAKAINETAKYILENRLNNPMAAQLLAKLNEQNPRSTPLTMEAVAHQYAVAMIQRFNVGQVTGEHRLAAFVTSKAMMRYYPQVLRGVARENNWSEAQFKGAMEMVSKAIEASRAQQLAATPGGEHNDPHVSVVTAAGQHVSAPVIAANPHAVTTTAPNGTKTTSYEVTGQRKETDHVVQLDEIVVVGRRRKGDDQFLQAFHEEQRKGSFTLKRRPVPVEVDTSLTDTSSSDTIGRPDPSALAKALVGGEAAAKRFQQGAVATQDGARDVQNKRAFVAAIRSEDRKIQQDKPGAVILELQAARVNSRNVLEPAIRGIAWRPGSGRNIGTA